MVEGQGCLLSFINAEMDFINRSVDVSDILALCIHGVLTVGETIGIPGDPDVYLVEETVS